MAVVYRCSDRCSDRCRSRLVQVASCVYRCPDCRSVWWVKRGFRGSPGERINLYDQPYPAANAIASLVSHIRDHAVPPHQEGDGT